MNAPDRIRLTEFSHGGGCGCKIAPAVLSEILAASPVRGLPPELL
ncbi:MAG: selenide, water dikinase SelD, partial [Betaproteobacteria bacterium]|nr:selenide, water dikinase SelD [Betaproteobacteria bacterium]